MTRAIFAGLVFILAALPVRADPDPREEENWKTDFSRHSVELSQIISGGPPRDGIPSIDNPRFAPLAEVDIPENAPVIALTVNEESRAYPLSILMWHEIANDVVGGEPVAVTYCPLCNAAIVFSRKLDGRTLDFGTTGRLRHSDLIMYDRQTESWWQQFSGEAIVGELTGAELTMLPATMLPYSRFSKTHPDGKVLVANNPGLRRYGANPYAYYDTSARPFLYRGELPPGIGPMERVIIAETGGGPLIIAMKALREAGEIERDGLVIAWQPGMVSALDAPMIAESRDVGHVNVSRNGKNVAHHVTFAFVAHAFHPDVEIEGR